MRWLTFPNNKQNKYHNKKVCVNGKIFDSKKEALRYIELVRMEQAGFIVDLETQPKFILQSKFKKNGKTIQAIIYFADFMYRETKSNKIIVEDVKGVRTEVYKIKKKLFEYKYPDLTIVEI